MSNGQCPKCESTETVLHYDREDMSEEVYEFECKDCGCEFEERYEVERTLIEVSIVDED